MAAIDQQALAAQMVHDVTGVWRAQIVYVAAKLDLADHLYESPLTVEQLAAKTNTKAPALYRLLRALASLGIFRADNQQRFHVTPFGETLRSDSENSCKHSVLMWIGDQYLAWTEFLYTIRKGKPGFEKMYGVPYYEHLKSNPSEFQNLRRTCIEYTRNFNLTIPKHYDFSKFEHIVDVGGNDGTFLIHVLQSAPKAKGTLFDEEPAIEEAKINVANSDVKNRMTCVAGSFLNAPVPAGGDCYTMKSVIADWEDSDAIKIFKNIREQMKPDAKFLLIQSVVPERNEYHPGKWYDLLYLLVTSGIERTRRETEDVLRKGGFQLNRIIKTTYPLYDIIESTAV